MRSILRRPGIYKALPSFAILVTAAWLAAPAPASASLVHITNFGKTNNICASLNKQFPDSDAGACTSGFRVGQTPNSSFDFDPSTYTSPNAVPGYPLVNNGVDFLIQADSSGFDFSEICISQFGNCSSTLPVTVGVADVTNVYLLVGAYFGTSFNVQLNGTGGASQTFNNIGTPDFCGNTSINDNPQAGVSRFTTFQVNDTGGCGTGNSSNGSNTTYNMTEIVLGLSPAFQGQTLNSLTITTNGNTTLLYGVTVSSSTPEPGTFGFLGAGMAAVLLFSRRVGFGRLRAAGNR